jgi:predicted transcriptional regulator
LSEFNCCDLSYRIAGLKHNHQKEIQNACKQAVLQISMYDLSSIQQSIENSKNKLIKMKPASYPFEGKIDVQRSE